MATYVTSEIEMLIDTMDEEFIRQIRSDEVDPDGQDLKAFGAWIYIKHILKHYEELCVRVEDLELRVKKMSEKKGEGT